MIDQAQTDKLQELLALSKNILVIFPETKDLDLFLATYCLYNFLASQSNARLLSPKFKQKIPNELNNLIEGKKVEVEIGKENLLISFPYREEQVENVSYFIGEDDKRFYLTIKPKKGAAPLNSNDVEFSYVGGRADLLILCGVEDLESLEQLYFAYEDLYKAANSHLVTINNFISDFGNLNLEISPTSSYCEAVFFLLKNLDKDSQAIFAKSNIPTLLLYGIEYKSGGLQSFDIDATTFLVVGQLLQLGAVRLFKLDTKTKESKVKIFTKNQKPIEQRQIHSIKQIS